MFCSSCGQAMQSFEQVCIRCGRPVPPMPLARPALYSRVQRHIQTVAVLWILWAALSMIGWLIALPFIASAFGGWGFREHGGHWFYGFGPGPHFPHMPWLPGFITALVFGRALLAVITGVGLLRRAPWARTLALVTAFLTLIKPLTGTILAIYTLWVLLPVPSGEEYEQIALP